MSSERPAHGHDKTKAFETPYSERLFGKDLYARHHRSRFAWLRRKISTLADTTDISVLEVGCHDGRALSYIPRPVRRFVGFDAGWGGGLDRAREQFAANEGYSFFRSTQPRDVTNLTEKFDFIICMETLEHLEPPIVEQYLQAFSAKLDGFLLITVPNEKGIALLAKAIGARIFGIDRIYPYTRAEFFWALWGRLERVTRSEHKGFDYSTLVNLVRKYFKHVRVEGVSPVRRPLSLALTIGITASHRPLPWRRLKAPIQES